MYICTLHQHSCYGNLEEQSVLKKEILGVMPILIFKRNILSYGEEYDK
ncbi:hypothetical protein [Histophilus somni]|nr:hypothetical protein [Histophilus somni]